MNWRQKRVPWWALAVALIAFVIIAAMVIQRQNNDLAMLERTYDNVNARRILMQYEQSEKQRELNISNTADYIASKARENGYMMPNELHFVVENPEALTNHESLSQIQLATVEPAADASVQEEAPADADAEPTAAPEATSVPEENEP